MFIQIRESEEKQIVFSRYHVDKLLHGHSQNGCSICCQSIRVHFLYLFLFYLFSLHFLYLFSFSLPTLPFVY